MRHVVFASPDEFHRCADRFRCLDGRGDEIDIQAPAESSAEQGGVDVHLSGRQARLQPRPPPARLLHLGAHVQIAPVGFDIGGAIHGFHGRVRQHRQFVHGRDRARSAFERAPPRRPRARATSPGLVAAAFLRTA